MRRAERKTSDRLIVALDFTTLAPALAMARKLRGLVRTVKVGSALFTACGPPAVKRLRALGFEVMLDLKVFDIPNTVELSCRSATRLRVSKLTVHAAGGRRMLEAAVQGVRDEAQRMRLAPSQRPAVLAVTVLTSVERGASSILAPRVKHLARAALEAGCNGVVASVEEARDIRTMFHHDQFEIICPGIRPSWAFRDDQRRLGTPTQALQAGADLLVVGRPIIAARDPAVAARRILKEMEATSC